MSIHAKNPSATATAAGSVHAPDMDQERRSSRRGVRRLELCCHSTAWPRRPSACTGRTRHCRRIRHEDHRRDDCRQGPRLHPQRHQHLQRHSVCAQHRRHAEIHAARETRSMDGRAELARARSVEPAAIQLHISRPPRRLEQRRRSVHVRLGRRSAVGRLPAGQCVDAGHQRQPAPAGLVWIHGGGYSSGSSNELRMYDGESLSRRGDAVVVSLNHRLGVLGYLNLAEYGEQWARASNVGHAGHRCGAGVGARQHRQFRRRPAQRADLRAVGRRRQGRHADGHADGEGAVPAGRDTERLRCPQAGAGSIAGAGRGRAERARDRSVEHQPGCRSCRTSASSRPD